MENKNRYEFLLKSGKGSYAKDALRLEFVYNGTIFTVGDLFDKIFQLEDQIRELKKDLAVKDHNQAKIDGLIADSIETLSTKVARLEYKNNKEEL